MNDKLHVSLEQHVCLVCGTAFDTGAILLDKRLRASMERRTATGWGLCPEQGSPRFQCNNWRYANPALARGWCW